MNDCCCFWWVQDSRCFVVDGYDANVSHGRHRKRGCRRRLPSLEIVGASWEPVVLTLPACAETWREIGSETLTPRSMHKNVNEWKGGERARVAHHVRVRAYTAYETRLLLLPAAAPIMMHLTGLPPGRTAPTPEGARRARGTKARAILQAGGQPWAVGDTATRSKGISPLTSSFLPFPFPPSPSNHTRNPQPHDPFARGSRIDGFGASPQRPQRRIPID
jgi:hypothetical protein